MKTNINTKIFIATTPTGDTDENKNYKELKYITEFTPNLSSKKEDLTYLHNKGDTTSIITGRSFNFSVSLTLNNNDELHNYLVGLILKDVKNYNNQYLKAEVDAAGEKGKKTRIKGKCAFEFKNFFPSGKPDELQTLQFDIHPQDDTFTVEEFS